MGAPILKKMEIRGKQWLNSLLRLFFRVRKPERLAPEEIQRILVFRLDQRIGNGILLLPLLRAIRKTRPDIELHLLIHHPVAELYREFAPGLVNRLWPYHQRQLLLRPWRFFRLLLNLRRQHFDVIFSSHNPDSFSLSQAFLGRFIKPRLLVGFLWKNSGDYYHIAVPSDTDRHYAESQLDFWRYFYPQATLEWEGLQVPRDMVNRAFQQWELPLPRKAALLWLGATGDKILPVEMLGFLYEQVRKITGLEVWLALGPADRHILQNLSPAFQEKVLGWNRPLRETAIFFSVFSLFISADTGPMHLAVALGVPTLTIFRHSRMEQYGYRDGKRHFSVVYRGSREDRTTIINVLQQLKLAIENDS